MLLKVENNLVSSVGFFRFFFFFFAFYYSPVTNILSIIPSAFSVTIIIAVEVEEEKKQHL